MIPVKGGGGWDGSLALPRSRCSRLGRYISQVFCGRTPSCRTFNLSPPETFSHQKGFLTRRKGFPTTHKGFFTTLKGFAAARKGFFMSRKGFFTLRKGFSAPRKGFLTLRTETFIRPKRPKLGTKGSNSFALKSISDEDAARSAASDALFELKLFPGADAATRFRGYRTNRADSAARETRWIRRGFSIRE